ncbi:hypothetical protein NC652_003726 [Populus alba x Populus x berolinensis]|nr:hypothetical protein NC652_003726 [Populus alba x Populus x berolinensis]
MHNNLEFIIYNTYVRFKILSIIFHEFSLKWYHHLDFEFVFSFKDLYAKLIVLLNTCIYIKKISTKVFAIT